MVQRWRVGIQAAIIVSVLALSSRFDGPDCFCHSVSPVFAFQYSLCRVVLMVPSAIRIWINGATRFSTRSVESF